MALRFIPDFSGSGDYSGSGDTAKQGYGRVYRLVYPSLSLLRPLLEEQVSQRQC